MFYLRLSISLYLLVNIICAEWIEKHDLSLSDYLQHCELLKDQKYSITNLCAFTDNNNDVKFNAIWENDKIIGSLIVKHNLTLDEYILLSKEYDPSVPVPMYPYTAYFPVSVCGYENNNQLYFSAIWEKRPSNFYKTSVNLTYDELLDQIYEFKTSRHQLRLSYLSAYTLNTIDYYTAVWEYTSSVDAWEINVRMSDDEYLTSADKYKSKGFRLRSLFGYELNKKIVYAALWEKISLLSPVKLEVSKSLSSDEYHSMVEKQKIKNFRPRFLNSFYSNGPRYNVIWEEEKIDLNSIKIIDEKVIEIFSKSNAHGVQLSITQDERLVYNKAYGRLDSSVNEPLDIENSIKMASVSKVFTMLGIIKLLETGRLKSLDQKLFGPNGILDGKYKIPEKNYKNFTKITARSLLQHKSGLASSGFEIELHTPDLSKEDMFNFYFYLDGIFSNKPEDEIFEYSNFGFSLLGAVIEEISGETYETYIRKNILIPCDITETMFMASNDGSSLKPAEVFYTPGSILNLNVLDSAGGWIARAQDLAKLMVRIDGQPNKPDIISKEMLEIVLKNNTLDYGLGLVINGNSYGHTGRAAGFVRSNSFNRGRKSVSFIMNSDTDVEEGVTPIIEIIERIQDWPDHDLFDNSNQLDKTTPSGSAGKRSSHFLVLLAYIIMIKLSIIFNE